MGGEQDTATDALAPPRIVEPRVNDRLRDDTVLWRYLDAAKLFDFLENSTLCFCRADHFSDKFEGAFTPSRRDGISQARSRGEIGYTYDEFKRRMRESVFINSYQPGQLEQGIVIPVDMARRLRSIVIGPDAPPWFDKLVRQSALRHGVKAPVRRSRLAADPI